MNQSILHYLKNAFKQMKIVNSAQNRQKISFLVLSIFITFFYNCTRVSNLHNKLTGFPIKQQALDTVLNRQGMTSAIIYPNYRNKNFYGGSKLEIQVKNVVFQLYCRFSLHRVIKQHLSLTQTNAVTRVFNFAKVQGDFRNNTRPYLRLPSCRATETASDSRKKTMQKRLFLWGVEVVIFGQSKNGEFSIKRHKTLMFYRSQILS